MPSWLLWLVAAGVLGVAEVATLTLVLGMLAVGALVAAVVAALGAEVGWQVLVFALTSLALLGLVRPIARSHLRMPRDVRTGVDALVGKRATVLVPVDAAGHGRVKIGGEEWTALPYDDHVVIPAGALVDVVAIEGATAIVYATEALP